MPESAYSCSPIAARRGSVLRYHHPWWMKGGKSVKFFGPEIPLSSKVLALLSWAVWGVIGIEVLVLDLMTIKAFAALVGGALALSWCVIARYHASRMATITNAHAEVMTKQVLAIEKFFEMGRRSDALANIQAAAASRLNGNDSGEFAIYRSGKN